MKQIKEIAMMLVAFGVTASVCAVASDAKPFGARNDGGTKEARIAEIAAMLPEKPCADGAPGSDRGKWTPFAATPQGRYVMREAESRLKAPVPVAPDSEYLEFTQNGNRTHYQDSRGKLTRGFRILYLAECLEWKGRFIPKIVEYTDAICAMRSWTLPAHDDKLTCFNGKPHIDLSSADMSLLLAFCLSWIGDALPAATREKILTELDRRTFKPYLAHARGERKIRGHHWFHGGNNWNSVCNSCVVRTALAVIPDRRLRAEFVFHAEGSVPFALNGYTSDGYCSEGIGYWNYGYGHHIMMGLSVRAATGGKVDFFADPKTKAVMLYAYGYQLEPGVSPYFADGGGKPSPFLLALGRQVWPDLVSTAALKMPLFDTHPAEFSLRAFGQEPPPAPPTMDVLPPRTWFGDAQVLISRAARGKDGPSFSIGFKGGHNEELHNHNDVGSYVIAMDGCEMCGDPGGEVYTRRTFSANRYDSKVLNSYGHPVPVIGGVLQKKGRDAAAKVLSKSFTPQEDALSIEYSAAYDVPALKSLVRTVTMNREECRITITDEALFSAPTTFEVPVVTYRDWERDGESLHFSFAKKTGSRRMSLDVSASAPLSFSSEEIENPGRSSPRRLAFKFGEPVLSAKFTTTFRAR